MVAAIGILAVVAAACAPPTGPPGPTPTPTDRIAASGSQVCVVNDDAVVECWGSGFLGVAGATGQVQRLEATPVAGTEGAVAVASAAGSTCALLDSGGVRCWGRNDQGQLGDGTTTTRPTPVAVAGITDAVALSMGEGGHACAVLAGGRVRCWGNNDRGQLGDGSTTDRSTPVQVRDVASARQVAVGPAHSCALLADRTVRCWGAGTSFELGNPLPLDQHTAVQVLGLPPATVLTAGGSFDPGGKPVGFSCALSVDGTEWCWGKEGPPRSDPTIPQRTGPADLVDIDDRCAITEDRTAHCTGLTVGDPGWAPVPGAPPVADLALLSGGLSQTGLCVLGTDGAAVCRGTNEGGRLGNGFGRSVATPRPAIAGLDDVIDLATGDAHACALGADGTVTCWGNSVLGQRGDGTFTYSPAPTSPGITDATAIGAGEFSTCAVRSGGSVECWGTGVTAATTATPQPVPGISDAVELDGGQGFVCARRVDGRVACWGASNTFGQLGDGTTTPSFTPVDVVGITGAVQVVAGFNHACAVLADGTARCWGRNATGEVGDGTTTTRTTPVPVVGLTQVASMTAGFGTTCATRDDGSVWCWGNSSSLPPTSGPDLRLPSPVPSVSGAADATLVGGGVSSPGPLCVVGDDELVRCSGSNGIDGLLGDGTLFGSGSGVVPTGLGATAQVASDGRFACARTVGGTVRCWGYDLDNQLGDGGPKDQTALGPVLGMP